MKLSMILSVSLLVLCSSVFSLSASAEQTNKAQVQIAQVDGADAATQAIATVVTSCFCDQSSDGSNCVIQCVEPRSASCSTSDNNNHCNCNCI